MFTITSKVPTFSLKPNYSQQIDMQRVVAVILGGGEGKRLYPLTKFRCKPAICFGGRYRLIDVPVSNAIHSGCEKIFIITQFLSTSLHRYISQTYNFGSLSSGFIDILSTEERHSQQIRFEGTADAVRKNLIHFLEIPADYFLILSGDQLYHMDFSKMVQFAVEMNSDAVVATLPVHEKDASRMGIMQINDRFAITKFHEKPKEKAHLSELFTPSIQLEKFGLPKASQRNYLASMGIYLFKRKVLFDLLQSDERHDFGRDLIPSMVKKGNICAFLHDGYWEDIGTISSYYEANIALTQPNAPFSYYSESHPIYTARYSVPGPKISRASISNSIICEGAVIEDNEISNSIIGPRTMIRKGTQISQSYLMGNDFYEPPINDSQQLPGELTIGENCILSKVILDKNVCIGNHVKLTNEKNLKEYDGEGVFIRDGIIVVTRGACLPDNFTL